MTTIVDYGAGNLRSVQNTLDALGARYTTTNEPAAVRSASRIILPGVGNFGQMMQAIDRLELRDPIIERIRAGVPFLGICIGLQCLFERSEEAPDARGLGILAVYLQDRFGWRAGLVQLAFDAVVLAAAFAVAAPYIVLCSVIGALVLNLFLTINHRSDRYVAV